MGNAEVRNNHTEVALMTDQQFPVFFSEPELLLAIEALQAQEAHHLKEHCPTRARNFGELADKLIPAGEKAI
jgi:hypothetical protein